MASANRNFIIGPEWFESGREMLAHARVFFGQFALHQLKLFRHRNRFGLIDGRCTYDSISILMSRRAVLFGILAALSAILLTATQAFSATAPGSLSAQEIINKTVDRAQSLRGSNKQADYSYSKFAVTEEFNAKGKLKEKKEKLLEFQSGYGRLSQVKLNGRSLTGAEFRK